MSAAKEHILVIRLGALGDLVFCAGAFAAIRQHHANAEIALLTRAPFAELARAMPWFDSIIIDPHPGICNIDGWRQLRRTITDFAPTHIYDLQGKNRQTVLYTLLGGPLGPSWSGAAPLCRYPRLWPPTQGMHFTEFLAAQLRAAGITGFPYSDFSWLTAPIGYLGLPDNYAVLIPACSPGAPHKRCPAEKFIQTAKALEQKGLSIVIIGTTSDSDIADPIAQQIPSCINLCGKTNLFELGEVLRHAKLVIGNDTGPTHMAAAIDAPTLALFSGASSPTWSKPPGNRVTVLQSPRLDDLDVDQVIAAAHLLL